MEGCMTRPALHNLCPKDLRRGFRNQDCELSHSCSIAKKLVVVTDDHVENRIETISRQRLIKICDKSVELLPSEL